MNACKQCGKCFSEAGSEGLMKEFTLEKSVMKANSVVSVLAEQEA